MATLKTLAGLNDTNFAKTLRERKKNVPKRLSNTLNNLITSVDNYLIAWEPANCNLMIKSLSDTERTWNNENKKISGKSDTYLNLSLTDPPVFDVQEIQANLDGSHVMLSGPQGLACVELPSNWTSFDGIKVPSEKIARSFYVGEKQLLCASSVRIQQAKWYPGSPSNTHVMVLTTDNSIRIYDVCNPTRPETTISISPNANQSSLRSGTATFSFVEDVAVAFDFGLPYEDSDAKSGLGGRDTKSTEATAVFKWPVYVLFSSGNLYTFDSTLTSNRSKKSPVVGPLTMWPQADDNYGSEACSILCLPVSPPVLVIAHQQGQIHHAILLPRDVELSDDEEDGRKLNLPDDLQSILSWASQKTRTEVNTKADAILYVTETLELDGDILEDNQLSAETYGGQGSIKLWKDQSCSSRYVISHDFGVHIVVVPLVNKLWDIAAKSDEAVGSEDTKQALMEESVVEFIVCTRTKSSDPAPPQGVVLHPLPPTLIVLLSSADIRAIPLSLLLKPSVKLSSIEEDIKPSKPVTRESFETRVRQLLQRTHSQPKLSLPPGTDLPVAEVIKLFSRCVQILREEYITKQDVVREEIEKRSRLLELHRQQQLEELDMIQKSKTELTNTAHRLAEKYEDAKEAQERFVERVEKVLYEIQRRSPVVSDAEKHMHIQIREFDVKLNKIKQNLEALRRREQLYISKVSQSAAQSNTTGYLNDQQLANLHEILIKQSEDIGALTKNVQLIKKDIGM